MDFNAKGLPIDLNKIKINTNKIAEIKNKDYFNDEFGGRFLDNYTSLITSKQPILLSVHLKKGVNVVEANNEDCGKEVTFLVSNYWPYKFQVPFNMSNHLNNCPTCNDNLKYINGVHQFLDRYSHFSYPIGWIETKNQYNCNKCELYYTQVERKFLFCESGYYVLNVKPTGKKEINTNPKYRIPRNIPLYYEKKTEEQMENSCNRWSEHKTIEWEGKCVVCDAEVQSFLEDLHGCCTGKTSLYGDFVCINCNLLHHAEEHDD